MESAIIVNTIYKLLKVSGKMKSFQYQILVAIRKSEFYRHEKLHRYGHYSAISFNAARLHDWHSSSD